MKMRIRSSLRDGLKDFSADEVRIFCLEAMDSLGLTPGGLCDAYLNRGWSSVCTVITLVFELLILLIFNSFSYHFIPLYFNSINDKTLQSN